MHVRRQAAAGVLFLTCAGACCAPMVNQSIDGVMGPFSYLSKPSALLGGIGAGGVTQVTWDGAFYTGAVELCVVSGDPPRPVAVRLKRLGGGHIPIVHYAWQDGEVRFYVSAFAAAPGEGADPANFIRLQARRTAESEQPAFIGFGLRHSGLDHRAGALRRREFNPSSRFGFARGCALIDDHAVCVMPNTRPARTHAVVGEPYKQPFTGDQFGVEQTTAVLLATWEVGKREELTVDLKMPLTPLPPEARRPLQVLKQAKYDDFVDQVSQAWQAELARGMNLLLPETKPVDAYKANLAYLFMAAEIPAEGKPHLQHRLRSEPMSAGESARLLEALDRAGYHPLARGIIDYWLDRRRDDGCLSPDGDVPDHCALMRAAISHAWLTGDGIWAEGIYPKIKPAADWLAAASDGGATEPDWRALVLTAEALDMAGQMAALLGKPEDAPGLRAHLENARSAAQIELAGQALPADLIPPIAGLSRGLPDSPEPEALGVRGEQATELCRRLRLSYAEGLATRDGMLSPPTTMDLAGLHAIRGEQPEAIRDLYSVLVHTGSCHGGFLSGVRPWSDRDSGESLSPDPLFSAAYVKLLRDLLIREQRDELHLFSGFSPEWMQKGEMVGVHNAPTTFGLVTAVMQVEEGGATVIMAADWHVAPSRVVVHLPYFVDVTSVDADRPGLKRGTGPDAMAYDEPERSSTEPAGWNQWLELRPDTTRVTMRWELRPGAQLSYETAAEQWRESYRKRYFEYIVEGNEPLPIEPVPLR